MEWLQLYVKVMASELSAFFSLSYVDAIMALFIKLYLLS